MKTIQIQSKVRVHGERSSAKGRVLTLVLDNEAPSEERKMYCMGCGYVLFHYYGAFRIVIFGDMQEPKTISRPIDLMCSTCKMIYRIA